MLGRTDSGRRLLLLLIVFVLAAGALVTRLGYWQLAQRDDLVESARRQIYFREEVPSRRGQIYDRSGTIVLAASVTRDRLVVSAQNMTEADRVAMVAFLTAQLELDEVAAAALQAKLETGRPYLVIAKDLLPERSETIETAAREAGIDKITIESDFARSYPQAGGSPDSTLAAHLIGFVNREGEGQYGVEQFYQGLLAGEPRVVEADRDAGGKPLVETERTVEPGVPGEDMRLTIDAGLQLALEQEVMAARIANGAQAVSAVVLDPWIEYARSSRHASLTRSTEGSTACSSGGENGIGTSGVATRTTGPSRSSKPRSAISAATCAPAAHVSLASSTITTFDVCGRRRGSPRRRAARASAGRAP